MNDKINKAYYCPPCAEADTIREMHGDVKQVKAQLESMNGSLLRTKERFDKHEDESHEFRRQTSIMWSALHAFKWAIGILIGAGGIGYLIRFVNGG